MQARRRGARLGPDQLWPSVTTSAVPPAWQTWVSGRAAAVWLRRNTRSSPAACHAAPDLSHAKQPAASSAPSPLSHSISFYLCLYLSLLRLRQTAPEMDLSVVSRGIFEGGLTSKAVFLNLQLEISRIDNSPRLYCQLFARLHQHTLSVKYVKFH